MCYVDILFIVFLFLSLIENNPMHEVDVDIYRNNEAF